MTTSFAEKTHDGGFILSEGPGHVCRENVVIEAAGVIEAGTVMAILDNSKYVIYNPAETDLSTVVKGVLIGRVDSTSADKAGAMIVRGPCELNGNELVWFSGASAGQKTTAITALAALGIIVR